MSSANRAWPSRYEISKRKAEGSTIAKANASIRGGNHQRVAAGQLIGTTAPKEDETSSGSKPRRGDEPKQYGLIAAGALRPDLVDPATRELAVQGFNDDIYAASNKHVMEARLITVARALAHGQHKVQEGDEADHRCRDQGDHDRWVIQRTLSTAAAAAAAVHRGALHGASPRCRRRLRCYWQTLSQVEISPARSPTTTHTAG